MFVPQQTVPYLVVIPQTMTVPCLVVLLVACGSTYSSRSRPRHSMDASRKIHPRPWRCWGQIGHHDCSTAVAAAIAVDIVAVVVVVVAATTVGSDVFGSSSRNIARRHHCDGSFPDPGASENYEGNGARL